MMPIDIELKRDFAAKSLSDGEDTGRSNPRLNGREQQSELNHRCGLISRRDRQERLELPRLQFAELVEASSQLAQPGKPGSWLSRDKTCCGNLIGNDLRGVFRGGDFHPVSEPFAAIKLPLSREQARDSGGNADESGLSQRQCRQSQLQPVD